MGSLQDFGLNVADFVCADLGSSTGGFTDCLLQNGAKKIYAIDVGYGQLAWKLRQDERVVVMERTNARYLTKLPDEIDCIVADLSFISLAKILPAMLRISRSNSIGILLVKPQFEVGPGGTDGGLVKGVPYYHVNIGGKPFEDQLAIMRRWLARHVGLNPDGTAKECVIIYDYLKLMNSADIKDVAEFQALGFMMTALHNFALKYSVPILSFIQLNRDGITKESTDAASGSDRIIWLCSNFTIYKVKSDEEIAQDGEEHGNRKLVPIIARHGQGLEDKDYINVRMKGQFAHLEEGLTARELEDGGNYVDDDEEFQSDQEDVPF